MIFARAGKINLSNTQLSNFPSKPQGAIPEEELSCHLLQETNNEGDANLTSGTQNGHDGDVNLTSGTPDGHDGDAN